MTQLNLQPETPSATAEVDALNVDLSNLSREELTELAFARLLTVMKAGTGFAPSELTIGGSKIFVALIDTIGSCELCRGKKLGDFCGQQES